MQVDAESLNMAIANGMKLVGEKDTSFHLYTTTRKGNIYLNILFLNNLISYAFRTQVSEELSEISLNPVILQKVIANKSGNLTLTPTSSHLKIKSKSSSAEIPLTGITIPNAAKSEIFQKTGENPVDISSLATLPASIKKILSSVKDNVTKEELAVRAKWNSDSIQLLISDNVHGILVDYKDKSTYKEANLMLPIKVFLAITSIANSKSTIFLQDSIITAISTHEYIRARLKETANSNITIDMMKGLFKGKKKTAIELSGKDVMMAISSCSSLSTNYPINLSSKKDGILKVSMKSDYGSVTESVQVVGNSKFPSIDINLNNLKDIISCMLGKFEMSSTDNLLLIEGKSDTLRVRGASALHAAEDDD
jgi:hypothetical protein